MEMFGLKLIAGTGFITAASFSLGGVHHEEEVSIRPSNEID